MGEPNCNRDELRPKSAPLSWPDPSPLSNPLPARGTRPAPHCALGLGLLSTALLAIGCAPTIASFRAEPNVICRGSKTTLSWRASADGRIAAKPALNGIGPVHETGAVAVSPATLAQFELEVHNAFGSAKRQVDVDVIENAAAKTIGGSVASPGTTCDASGVTVRANAPARFWDARLRVGKVSSADGRPYHVEHGGKSADIAAGASTDAFRGLTVSGAWKLKTPLAQGEACGVKVPHNLLIQIQPACGQ